MLDEMKIHRNLTFNGKEFIGGVDLGLELNDEDGEPEEATDALVFMVVGLNVKWKLPIGYFFIKGLTGSEKANIVNIALNKLRDVGASVCTLTSDGSHANQAMAKILCILVPWLILTFIKLSSTLIENFSTLIEQYSTLFEQFSTLFEHFRS